jgi:predicted HicB family RNase H-like nuclease
MKKSETKYLAIQVRVKPQEKNIAVKKAKEKGQSLCTFIRESIAKNK